MSTGVELITPPLPGNSARGNGYRASFTIDTRRIERAVREILSAIGEDPEREGLRETPTRVARAYAELLSGLMENAGTHLARTFDHEQPDDSSVILRDIRFTSMCEHHLLPFSGRAHVAYQPAGGKVTGLSKLARTVDVYARRPQLQERLTGQIADALVAHLHPHGVIVLVEAEHSCLRIRGARKEEAEMVTTAFRGNFASDRVLRAETIDLMRRRGCCR